MERREERKIGRDIACYEVGHRKIEREDNKRRERERAFPSSSAFVF